MDFFATTGRLGKNTSEGEMRGIKALDSRCSSPFAQTNIFRWLRGWGGGWALLPARPLWPRMACGPGHRVGQAALWQGGRTGRDPAPAHGPSGSRAMSEQQLKGKPEPKP